MSDLTPAEEEPRTVTVTVRYDDIEEAVGALGYVHADYCTSGHCTCGGAAERLAALLVND